MTHHRTTRTGLIAALLLLLLLPSCKLLQREQRLNTLSRSEERAGWQLLFNGESMEGWRGYKKQNVPSKWTVQDGAITLNKEGGEGGDIITVAQYDNFELSLDWKIGECGNSGIFFHVAEGNYGAVYNTGPEVQVLDNTCHPDAKNGPDRYAGANYALHPPSPADVVKPAGEWNNARVIVRGPHVEQWLNGRKVVEYELWSPDWQQRVKASKFVEMPDYGMMKKGHIALQDHGDPVAFRNIKIRPLNEPA